VVFVILPLLHKAGLVSPAVLYNATTLAIADESAMNFAPFRTLFSANFYEKALFVKPTWRLLLVTECNGFFCPFARYASIRTSCEPHSLRWLCAFDEIRLFGLKALQSSERSLLWGRPSSHGALASFDPKRVRAREAAAFATSP
jgi:hypothetical protein